MEDSEEREDMEDSEDREDIEDREDRDDRDDSEESVFAIRACAGRARERGVHVQGCAREGRGHVRTPRFSDRNIAFDHSRVGIV